MNTPRILSTCIARIIDWSIRLFRRFRRFRSYGSGHFSSELVPAFTFHQGKPVPVLVDIRRFR